MSDPREGLKLRLGYEVAREIERTPIISLGVQDAAVKAINSVLYQRLQDQIIDDNPTARILEERIRDINVTNIASENGINKADLIAVLQSGGFQGPPGPPGPPGDKGSQVKTLQVLLAHPQAHPVDQDQADHQGLADQEDQPWKKQQTLSNDLPMIHHHLQQNSGQWLIQMRRPMRRILPCKLRSKVYEKNYRNRQSKRKSHRRCKID